MGDSEGGCEVGFYVGLPLVYGFVSIWFVRLRVFALVGCTYASMVLLSFQYGCAFWSQLAGHNGRMANARIVDQNVNFSTEELCSILDFFSNAIYTLVMEQVKG